MTTPDEYIQRGAEWLSPRLRGKVLNLDFAELEKFTEEFLPGVRCLIPNRVIRVVEIERLKELLGERERTG